MANPTVRAELVLACQNATGESPVWHAAEQALYWVDIPARTLWRYDPVQQRAHAWTAPEMLACITPAPQPGHWLAGAQSGAFLLRPHSEDAPLDTAAVAANGQPVQPVSSWQRVASVAHPYPNMRFNDGRCDRQGRFFAGTLRMDAHGGPPPGQVYRLDGAQLQPVLPGFVTPNGMAFSPDGRRMYLSDSNAAVRQVWVFDYDTERGLPHSPRPFIDMQDFAGRPDGAAMDSDGCYWICGIDAGVVQRFTPQGRLDRVVQLPVPKPTMCAFGGADLRTLYITSIRPAGTTQGPDGGLFAVQLADVQGMAETPWRG